MASLLPALLKVDDVQFHEWPQGAQDVLMGALYDVLARDPHIQGQLVKALTERNLDNLNTLYTKLSSKMETHYNALVNNGPDELPRQALQNQYNILILKESAL